MILKIFLVGLALACQVYGQQAQSQTYSLPSWLDPFGLTRPRPALFSVSRVPITSTPLFGFRPAQGGSQSPPPATPPVAPQSTNTAPAQAPMRPVFGLASVPLFGLRPIQVNPPAGAPGSPSKSQDSPPVDPAKTAEAAAAAAVDPAKTAEAAAAAAAVDTAKTAEAAAAAAVDTAKTAEAAAPGTAEKAA